MSETEERHESKSRESNVRSGSLTQQQQQQNGKNKKARENFSNTQIRMKISKLEK